MYIYICVYIYSCTRKPPYQDGADNLCPPRALSVDTQNREIPCVFKENVVGLLPVPVRACHRLSKPTISYEAGKCCCQVRVITQPS